MKSIDTLVPDIQRLFDEGANLSQVTLEKFAYAISDNISERFQEYGKERSPTLRLSNIGKPLRQLWYELRGYKGEVLQASAKMKFLYGDVLEDLLILLAIEAGHEVTDLQKKVEVDGVVGSIDCIIDGVLIDVKSASSNSFSKFKSGEILENDPFGYVAQLAAYSAALGGLRSGWLVVDKTLGHIEFLEVPQEKLIAYDVSSRIQTVRKCLESDTPPECCCQPVPEGKSGNYKLPVQGSYCPYKRLCYPELRTFLYSYGPVYLTSVEREPKVYEQKQEGENPNG